MADNYVDRFIKQHREYFQRNKKVIENNSWKDEKANSEAQIERLFDQISKLKEKSDKKSQTETKKLQKEVFEIKNTASKRKDMLFKEETELTSSILGRLSAFIKETESNGDRSLQKVQNFIDKTVEIINIHLDKCDEYLDYSMDDLVDEVDTEEDIELRSDEIKFQDSVFQKKIKIQDELGKLNISNSIQNISIKFHKNEKASLLMREPLSLKSSKIKSLAENININYDITSSKEFLINMKKSDIPSWNTDKHFWEQDDSTWQFWEEERYKITQGININGYWVHPWLYWHLNIFKTPIPLEDGTEPTINPFFRDNEYFFCENLSEAEKAKDRGLMLYGTRRFTKSVLLASYVQWKAYTKPNSTATVTGGSDGDLADLTDKIKTSM